MFQRKIDDMFKEFPNLFGIPGDILVVGHDDDHDGTDHNNTMEKCYLHAGQ